MRIVLFKPAQADLLNQFLRPAPPFSRPHTANLQGDPHIFHEDPPREQIILLGHIPDLRIDPVDRPAAKENAAGARREEPDDEIEERGLPAAGRTHHRDKLSFLKSKGDGVEGDNPFSPDLKLLADLFNGEERRHDS